MALALLGAAAGQGVVWSTGQFYALFFLLIYLKLDFIPTYALIGLSLVLGTPFFTYFPLFRGLTHLVNPTHERYQQSTPIKVWGQRLQLPHLHWSVVETDRL